MPEADTTTGKIKLRSYQQEMLDASLARNVIVAMDTGSGKTPVATFRILAELERTDSTTLAWFLAPKVALAEQQHAVLVEHLPGYLIKTLLGRDNVDKWTDQKLWDATLANVRVVVSTPAILADALTHGFVHMSRLSLLVFDEAHNCIGNSPMNRIMRDFYHPSKDRLDAVPHILGLTASPVISSKSTKLDKLESGLDAVAITPKQHRLDLEVHVHPPEVTKVAYAAVPIHRDSQMPCLASLRRAVQTYDFSTDPYVIEVRELVDSGDVKALKRLEKIQLKCNTWCFKQLSCMMRKADAILEQLGPSAAEWYISECRRQYLLGEGAEALGVADVTQRERAHLAGLFKTMVPPQSDGGNTNGLDFASVTPKVDALVDALSQQHDPSSTNRAVIFAEQRAVVLSLAVLLQSSPQLSGKHRFGAFIGTSTSDRRKTAVADLVDLKGQSEDLKSFRNDDRVNVLVATSVLEEGIDVSACNLVACFDPPKNLVQFVQRRGRARQKGSRYLMLLPEGDLIGRTDHFAQLEQQMKELYRSERGEPGAYMEEEDDQVSREYRVESTRALLHFDNAKAHLYHFCAVSVDASKYIDARPEFDTEQGSEKRWRATTILPSFVHSSLRVTESLETWPKEETAIKDAAFQAYVGLHKAGLVNDNLLPYTQGGPDPGQTHVDQPSIVTVPQMQSSWRRFCEATMASNVRWYASDIRLLREDGTELACLILYLPNSANVSQTIDLYWNTTTSYKAIIEATETERCMTPAANNLVDSQAMTDSFLRSIFASRMTVTPEQLPFLLFSEDLKQAIHGPDGAGEALRRLRAGELPANCGLVRVVGQAGPAYFLSGVKKAENRSEEPTVSVTAFPRRRDFLHPVHATEQNAAYTARQTVPLSQCAVDALPAKYALFAAFMPSILHRIDATLIATELQSNILPTVPITNQALLLEATSSPSAREVRDYNRLEFLGDAVLKFCASLQAMAQHPTWPEGYLSMEKTRIVSNNYLTKAAIALGLDKYIMTKPFTGAKWRPPYVDEVLAAQSESRELSTKVLADVVEALIGAAFVDGALAKAHDCIRALLPVEEWIALPDCISRIVAESAQQKRIELGLVERLVGHTFEQPELLLEALTHASCPRTSGRSSYERLEFLGDAVLDLIIVPKLCAHPRQPRHWDLHRMRDALVNGHYLAHCCMQYSIEEDRFDVVPDNQDFNIQQSKREVHLYDFLRAGSEVMRAKRECLEQSAIHLQHVQRALDHDAQYPWPELIAFEPPKFFSDIVESTLGALFLDTAGSISACEAFVDKLGIFETMRRILDEHMETAYPKEQLGILADKESVTYVPVSHKDDDGVTTFSCTVKVGGEDVANVASFRSKKEAELRAARKATAVLEGRLQANGSGKKRKLDVAMHTENTAMSATNYDDE